MLEEATFRGLARRLAGATGVGTSASEAIACLRRARRTIAARLALAVARERLVDATAGNDSLTLFVRSEKLVLPLNRTRAFELHEPDLELERGAALELPGALWEWLAPALVGAEATDDVRARVASELDDSADGLALALWVDRIRRARDGMLERGPTDGEHLVLAGHPWHPMCKTRLGIGRPVSLLERLQIGPELFARARVTAVDVRADLARTQGPLVDALAPWFGVATQGRVRIPVLAAQLHRLPALLGDSWGHGVVPVGAVRRRARPLLSVRSVALPHSGPSTIHLKLALDVLTTSARRGVSPMSVMNGPRVGELVRRIQATDRATAGLHVVGEDATAGLDPTHFGAVARQVGVIVRAGTELRDPDGDTIVCAALGERDPRDSRLLVATLADGYPGSSRARGESMLAGYVAALAPPVLRFACAHGIALEAHLQNTLVVRANGRPQRFIVRDLGGIRLHRPRLARAGHSIELAPGSFIATDDLAELQSKVMHALVHAHLAELIGWTELALGVPEAVGWSIVRSAFSSCLERWSAEPRLRHACAEDRAAWLGPRCRAKALFRMRMRDSSSDYSWVELDNVLGHATAHSGGTVAQGAGAPDSCRQ